MCVVALALQSSWQQTQSAHPLGCLVEWIDVIVSQGERKILIAQAYPEFVCTCCTRLYGCIVNSKLLGAALFSRNAFADVGLNALNKWEPYILARVQVNCAIDDPVQSAFLWPMLTDRTLQGTK